MALRIFWGSESGDASEPEIFEASGTLSFNQTSIKHGAGARALRCNPSSGTAVFRLRGLGANGRGADFSLVTAYMGAAFYLATKPDYAINIATLTNTSNNPLIRIRWEPETDEIVCGYFDSSGTFQTIATYPWTETNAWGYVECAGIGIDTGNAEVQWRVNGVQQTGATGLTIRSVSDRFSRVFVGQGVAHSGDYYFDDIYVDDAGFLGPVNVVRLAPDGDGTDTGFTASGTGNTFAEVDEVPHDSDTTYRRATTVTQFTSTVANLPAGTQDIKAVKAVIVSRDEGSTSARIRSRLRSGSTIDETTAMRPNTTYIGISKIYDTDPNTSTAWTLSAVNAIEVGAASTASVAVRVTSVHAQVLYPRLGQGPLLGQHRNRLVRAS
jgi:hypothetical protein